MDVLNSSMMFVRDRFWAYFKFF